MQKQKSKFLFDANSKWTYLNLLPWFLGIITFILYFPSRKGEFVWDDRTYFMYNDILINLSPFDLKEIFGASSNYWGELLPVRDYMYVLQYKLFGMDPYGYHLVSIILFIFAGGVLYLWLHRVFKDFLTDKGRTELLPIFPKIGAAIALFLFMVNPIYVESVAYISGQKDLLSMFFILVSLSFFYRYGRQSDGKQLWVFVLGILFFYISVLSKFSALGTIFCIPFLWLTTSNKDVKAKIRMMGAWLLATIPSILWLFYVASIGANFTTVLTSTPFLERILRGFNIIGVHLDHIFWPWPMTFKYPFDNVWSFDIFFVIGLCYVLLLVFFILKRTRSLMTLGLVIFGTYLLPTLQFFGDFPGGKIYDRYLDVPLIGVIVISVLLIYGLYNIWKKGTLIFLGALLIAGISLGWVTHNYIPTWQSNITSNKHIYQTYPQSEELLINYVTALISGGELELAEFFITTQMNDMKVDWLQEYFLGRIAYNRRNFDKAYHLFLTASVKSNKAGSYPLPNIFLAEIMIMKGDKETARELLQPLLLIKIDPMISFRAQQLMNSLDRESNENND